MRIRCEAQAFEPYIAAHRPGAGGLHVNYNSWHTTLFRFAERDFLNLQGGAWIAVPSVAREALGLIRVICDPMPNDAAATLLRGGYSLPAAPSEICGAAG